MQIDFTYKFSKLAQLMFEPANQSLNKTKKIQTSRKAYNCIHLDPTIFVRTLSNAREALSEAGIHFERTFLDVGCGLGQKVCLAQTEGFAASGLELRAPYVKQAQKLMRQFFYNIWAGDDESRKSSVPQIIRGDAIKFKEYDKYNVIYFYRPAPDEKVQAKIELAIATGAKAGAIVIAIGAQSFHNKEFQKQHGFEALKNKNGDTVNYCYIKTGVKNA